MPRAHFVLCLWLFLATLACFADHVTLNNDDRLTGTIVKSDGKVLTLKTDALGTVEIQMPAIRSFSSDKTMFLETGSTKQTYSGVVQAAGDSVTIITPSGPPVTIAKGEIASLRSAEEHQAYEKAQHPGLTQGWTGGANVGFGLTGGNSQTANLGLGFNAIRQGANDKITAYATSVYSVNNAPGASPSTTANTVEGGIRYDHDLTPRLFAFVSADFMADELQTLDLRSVLGGGLGYHIIKSDSTTLDLLAGANYTREHYDAFTRSFPSALAGEELMHKFRRNTVITQKLHFYPNLSDVGEYRTQFDLGSVTKISKWFGWQLTFSDVYITNPPPGKKGNDIVFTTGLNVAFAH